MRQSFAVFRVLVAFLAAALPLASRASQVSAERASQVAAAFLRLPSTRGGESVLRLAWDSNARAGATRSDAGPLYYVFEPRMGGGFVIVSAEDRVRPILGWSRQGAAPRPDNLPDGMAWWLDFVADGIRRAGQGGVQSAAVARQWKQAAVGNVVVELQTAEWNQGAPFNWQCPLLNGQRCITGCSQTAAAIVMRYHRWPARGRGVTEAYVTYTSGINVPARDLNHAYDWDHMPLGSSGFSNAEGQAISTLMADIGYAAQADYGVEETRAFVGPDLLYKYFDYAPDMFYEWRENFPDERWFGMVRGELDAARPLLYTGGGGPRGSHAFVLDGYTDDDYFHVNWGWGGYYNGFYTLEALNPGSDYFSGQQMAIFGVRPNDGSEPKDWLRFYDGAWKLLEEVERGKPFFFEIATVYNPLKCPFKGKVRCELVDRNGKSKEVVSDEFPADMEGEGSRDFSGSYFRYLINGPIDFGDRLRIYYKSKNSADWHLVKPVDDTVTGWEIPVADDCSIAESTSFTFDRRRRIITLSTKRGVTAELFSAGGDNLTSQLMIEGTTIRIPVKELPAGSYTIRMTKRDDVKELTFTVKPYNR